MRVQVAWPESDDKHRGSMLSLPLPRLRARIVHRNRLPRTPDVPGGAWHRRGGVARCRTMLSKLATLSLSSPRVGGCTACQKPCTAKRARAVLYGHNGTARGKCLL